MGAGALGLAVGTALAAAALAGGSGVASAETSNRRFCLAAFSDHTCEGYLAVGKTGCPTYAGAPDEVCQLAGPHHRCPVGLSQRQNRVRSGLRHALNDPSGNAAHSAAAAFTVPTVQSGTQAAVTTTSLFHNPITVAPTLTLVDGIINGTTNAVDSTGATLTYTVASSPSAGGKITFLAPGDTGYTPGAFTYLPDQSVLGSGTEQFKILVAHYTQFDHSLRFSSALPE